MAFIERYVSVTGGGAHDGTSEADAWTFAEMITALTGTFGGYRVNMKVGSYSSGAVTTAAGTVSALFVIRGYNSTIGDLDGQGVDSTGYLDTTNFPDLTLTGILTISEFAVIQNLDITGSLNGTLIGNTATDRDSMISCRVHNTANNASASCVYGDDSLRAINCDFECSGATHSRLIICDIMCEFINCRFRAADDTMPIIEIAYGQFEFCTFEGISTTKAINFDSALTATRTNRVSHCTFYGLGTCIEIVNSAPGDLLILSHNHATDCGKWVDNLYSATANISTIESYNRLRDITTPRTGVEAVIIGEITTDTGGAETDYVDAANGDFHLIEGAAGYSAGINGQDIGAWQHADPAGGGGAGGAAILQGTILRG